MHGQAIKKSPLSRGFSTIYWFSESTSQNGFATPPD
jgi:hypothetical protein